MDYAAIGRKALGQTEYFLRKNGPTILTGVGIAGFMGTTYLVGKAVLKAQEPVKELKLKIGEIRLKEVDENYTQNDKVMEAGRTFIFGSLGIAKIFTPAIITGAISIACIVSSHGMMKNRQASLVAAYVALDEGFKAYRRRVIAEVGGEKEEELYHGVKLRALEQAEGEDPKCEIDYDDKMPSQYARFFDEYSTCWSKTNEWNLTFVRQQQRYLNDRLQTRGFVFLNEVYEALGIPWSQAGQVVGWKYKSDGDSFIDFGMWVNSDEASRAFVNGIDNSVLLDFNVDGPIGI
jgi:hypothetical protein